MKDIKVGDKVLISLKAKNAEIDFEAPLRGNTFRVIDVAKNSSRLNIMVDYRRGWWVQDTCCSVITVEQEVLTKVALMRQRFEKRNIA